MRAWHPPAISLLGAVVRIVSFARLLSEVNAIPLARHASGGDPLDLTVGLGIFDARVFFAEAGEKQAHVSHALPADDLLAAIFLDQVIDA